MKSTEFKSLTSFIWSVADLLRGSFKQSEYGQVIMPFVVMRRLDCLLEDTKDAVINAYQSLPDDADESFKAWRLQKAADTDIKVYNTSRNTFARLRNQSPKQLRDNLIDYIGHFSPAVSQVFTDNYNMIEILRRLEETETLWPVFDRFCQVDLHPERIDNLTMGYLFEELLRKFSEMSNETAGEHFTPREIIRLCMALLMAGDEQASSGARVIRSLYDPTCGGGGGLSVGSQALHEINQNLIIQPYGQEMNPASYGICQSDMLIRGEDPENIALGNTLTSDKHKDKKFHLMFANPPYGVDWKRSKAEIETEHKTQGYDGRFGAGLPRTSDGQLLFVQHMVSKFREDAQGSRAAIVMNGSPLFTGGAGSGESEIRRWLLENDLIDAIVALPTDLFYNTGIQTYVYLLANRKPDARKGKVQLIDASGERFWKAMRKSLGSKRREVPATAINEIVDIYKTMPDGDHELVQFSRVFATGEFGYREIRVERPLRLRFNINEKAVYGLSNEKPIQKLDRDVQEALTATILTRLGGQEWTDRALFLKALNKALDSAGIKVGAPVKKALISALGERDENAEICYDKNGVPEADPSLRDHELLPLDQDWRDYVAREVTHFVPDAWVDEKHCDPATGQVGRIGYEVSFNRYFNTYTPPRPLVEIASELKAMEAEIAGLINEVMGFQDNLATEIRSAILDEKGTPYRGDFVRSGSRIVNLTSENPRFIPTPLSRIAKIVGRGSGQSSDVSDKGETFYITPEDLNSVIASPTRKTAHTADGMPGDLAVCLIASVGKCSVVSEAFRANPQIAIVRATECNNIWLSYALQAAKEDVIANANMSGVMPFINGSEFMRTILPVPSLEEQEMIANQLDQFSKLTSSLMDASLKRISQLQEYRSSLIAAAVTGQIDIGSWRQSTPKGYQSPRVIKKAFA